MRLDRDVLEVILLTNRISAEKERAKLEPVKETVRHVATRMLVRDILERRIKDLMVVSAMLIRGGYCAPELPDKALLTTVDYLNARGQRTAVFSHDFVARRVTIDLGFNGPEATSDLAGFVTEKLSELGYKNLRATTRHNEENVYIMTT